MILEFIKNKKVYVEGIKDGLTGKETKASKLLHKAEGETAITSDEADKGENCGNAVYTSAEIQQVINTLRKSVLITATCIRILTDAIVNDDGTDPKKFKEFKQQLEELGTKEVMSQISLMLEEKNKRLLDESSYHILSAFRKGCLIVDGETIPITKYFDEKATEHRYT